jgi:hypothetical protein
MWRRLDLYVARPDMGQWHPSPVRVRGLDGLAQRSDAVRKKAQLFELGSNSWR